MVLKNTKKMINEEEKALNDRRIGLKYKEKKTCKISKRFNYKFLVELKMKEIITRTNTVVLLLTIYFPSLIFSTLTLCFNAYFWTC